MPVRLFYCQCGGKTNFGDQLNPFLYRLITGRAAKFADPAKVSPDTTVYFAIGSIMHRVRSNVVVWGSGIIGEQRKMAKPRKTLAVRGPITRAKMLSLGYRCPQVYGDPALLLPRVYRPVVEHRHRFGVVPHYVDIDAARRWFPPEVKFINVLQRDVRRVVNDIASCQTVFASSLHGLIVAHAYGIRAVWIKLSGRILGNGVKYQDYYGGIGMTAPKPVVIKGSVGLIQLRLYAASYPNPKFPIDTDRLWQSCPWKRGQAVRGQSPEGLAPWGEPWATPLEPPALRQGS